MNPSTAIYNVLSAEIDAAVSGSPIFESAIHGDSYEVFESGLVIRVGDVFGSELQPDTSETEGVREESAMLFIDIVFVPVSDDITHRFEARDAANAAGKEVARILWVTQDFGGCFMIGQILKQNDWFMPKTIKMPYTRLRVLFNPRS